MSDVAHRDASSLSIGAADAYRRDVYVRVLGPVGVLQDGVEVALGGPKQRTVLALLATRAREVVPVDALIGVWGEEPTPGARSTLQSATSSSPRPTGPTCTS